MFKRYFLSLFILTAFFASSVKSQSNSDATLVVPGAYASTVGTATFTGPTGNTARTYQMLINANQLTAYIGTYITSITFRNLTSATTAWPTADITVTNYDIYLAPGVPPAERHTTFDSNIVGTKVQVRSGSYTFPANCYGIGTAPHPFGNPPINFNTGYLYTGGHLVIEIRHTGFTGTSRANDAISTSTPGYFSDFSAGWAGSYTGTTVTNGNFCIAQLTNSLVPVGVTAPTVLANEFRLLQNYPNPFNPSTKIDYEIPYDSKVVLSVYDMLGKEVATLVNNSLQRAGYYSVDFNAANLTSGAYYYKISAQGNGKNFTMTNKMILIK